MEKTTDSDFDPGVWAELLQLFGRDGVTEMVETLQRDLPLQRDQLTEALAGEDRQMLKRIAHNLRGVALQFGAEPLAQSCGGIEQSVVSDVPTAQIAADAAQMLARYAALLRALKASLHDT